MANEKLQSLQQEALRNVIDRRIESNPELLARDNPPPHPDPPPPVTTTPNENDPGPFKGAPTESGEPPNQFASTFLEPATNTIFLSGISPFQTFVFLKQQYVLVFQNPQLQLWLAIQIPCGFPIILPGITPVTKLDVPGATMISNIGPTASPQAIGARVGPQSIAAKLALCGGPALNLLATLQEIAADLVDLDLPDAAADVLVAAEGAPDSLTQEQEAAAEPFYADALAELRGLAADVPEEPLPTVEELEEELEEQFTITIVDEEEPEEIDFGIDINIIT